jgi:uncharacterized protein DUF6690
MKGMVGKPGWLLALLAGTFVVPYTLCDKQFRATVARLLAGSESASAANPASTPSPAPGNTAVVSPAPMPLSPQAPPCDLASALRFDVTPQWVTGTWPKVTTAVADTRYSGLRVPLVTGVMPDDLVGTLTYYFDNKQRLERITFAGSTADPRRLVSLVTGQYRLAPQPTLGAGLYQSKWNGKVISTLEVRQATIPSESSRGSYEVQLDLNRADLLAGTDTAPRRLFGW